MYTKQKEREYEAFTSGLVNLNQVYWGHRKSRSLPHPQGVMIKYRESIDYGVGARFNPCTASKSRHYIGWSASRGCFSNTDWYVRAGNYERQTKPEAVQRDSAYLTVDPQGSVRIKADQALVEQRQFDAYQKLIYLIDVEHMNFARSLYELRDMKDTILPFVEFYRWCRNLIKGRVRLPRDLSKAMGKNFGLLTSCAKMAKAYLWYKFGVEPTVQDVKQFTAQMSAGKLSVQGRKDPIRVPKGSVVVQRYSANPGIGRVSNEMFSNFGKVDQSGVRYGEVSDLKLRWPNYSTYHTFPNPFPEGSCWVRPKTVTTEFVRGAYFAEVIKDIEIPGDVHHARQMAWNCPMANTAWELVPFSFVVDWFVDVGTAIHNLEKLSIGVSERTKLGPIWHACQTVTDTYRPALQAANWSLEGVEPPEDRSSGGTLLVKGSWSCAPQLEDRELGFTRIPSTRPALPSLQFSTTVKAYQISTGMALLASAAWG